MSERDARPTGAMETPDRPEPAWAGVLRPVRSVLVAAQPGDEPGGPGAFAAPEAAPPSWSALGRDGRSAWRLTVRVDPDWPVTLRLGGGAGRSLAPAWVALRRRGRAAGGPAGVLEDLAGLPALGAGRRIPDRVRVMLERVTGRDLSGVRIHASPVASRLGAEAFTTGRHVVAAPGRLDLDTPGGVVLLGHEVAHLGEILKFKMAPGVDRRSDDPQEQRARWQELAVRQAVERRWREESSARPGEGARATPASAGGEPDGRLAGPFRSVELPRGPTAPRPDDGAAPRGAPGGAAATAPAVRDLDALARRVYNLIRHRLRSECERAAGRGG